MSVISGYGDGVHCIHASTESFVNYGVVSKIIHDNRGAIAASSYSSCHLRKAHVFVTCTSTL